MKRLPSSAAIAIAATSLLTATATQANITNINASSNPVLYWNTFVLTLPGSPPAQSRAAAMINIAMHDAANAALGSPDKTYLTGVSSSIGDPNVAVAQAAHDMLVSLNSGNAAAVQSYDNALTTYLASIPNTVAKTNAIATGAAYASQMLAVRSSDGSATAGFPATPYTPGSNPGDWNPTPPPPGGSPNPALPGWGQVTEFLIGNSDNFVPGAPPALNSAAYTAAYNEVKLIGAAGAPLNVRSLDQTNAANWWNAATGTTWLQFGLDVAEAKNLSTLDNSALFATLTSALADAFIVGFDTKYTYNFWRPITAIRAGDTDGNPLTAGDTTWNSLFPAPEHPSYLSTHSIASGAASTVLAAWFGNEPFGGNQFCETLINTNRCYTSFSGMAEEGSMSRVWGGIHFSFDTTAGLAAGRSVGSFIVSQNAFGAVPEPSTWTMLLVGFAAIGLRQRRRRRQGALAQVA
jgi:hypothetical protein